MASMMVLVMLKEWLAQEFVDPCCINDSRCGTTSRQVSTKRRVAENDWEALDGLVDVPGLSNPGPPFGSKQGQMRVFRRNLFLG